MILKWCGMNKKLQILALSLAVIFVVSAAVSAYILLRPDSKVVEIISDGETLFTLDLSQEPDREISVEYEGRKNIIAIENHEIYMKDADCPDHICIKTGRLGETGAPIVCLPNKLIIRYKNGGDVDAAT